MNRLSKTESSVLKLWMLYLQRIVFTDYLETTTAVVVPCGGPKSLPVHRYSVVIFTFSIPLGLWDSTRLFESRVALKTGLNRLNKTESALDVVFPKDRFYRLFGLSPPPMQVHYSKLFLVLVSVCKPIFKRFAAHFTTNPGPGWILTGNRKIYSRDLPH